MKQVNLYDRWKNLKNKTDAHSMAEMEEVEAELSNAYFDNLKKASKDLTCDEGGNIQKEI